MSADARGSPERCASGWIAKRDRANTQLIRLLRQRVPVLVFVNNHFAGHAPATLANGPKEAGQAKIALARIGEDCWAGRARQLGLYIPAAPMMPIPVPQPGNPLLLPKLGP